MEKTPQFSVTSFGDYVLLDRIAVGGMAEIFKAQQSGPRGFERILVIKRILQHLSDDHEFKQMFDDEAKIAAQLRHANIVQIFELGDVEGTPYIAMEYVEGRNLRDLTRALQSKGLQLSIEQTLFIMNETLRGLHYAHHRTDSNGNALEIIHRDMSPQNIILSYEGEVKILDFGIAKAASRISKTEAGVLKGKFSYMSPEQASGRGVTQSTDIYATAVIFHELLTGERLFRAETDVETIERVKIGVVPRPSERNVAIPTELDAIVLKGLQRSPDKRYATAGDMQADISKLMREKNFVYGAQELSAFMKTLFSEVIKDERERLRVALLKVPETIRSNAARTHIAFKAETNSRKNLTRVANPKRKNRSFAILLGLFMVCLGIYAFIQSGGLKDWMSDEAPITPRIPARPIERPTEIPDPIPSESELPPNSQPKVDEILNVEKPEIKQEEVEPEPEPKPRDSTSRPRTRPRVTPKPTTPVGSGTLHVFAPPNSFGELFIDGKRYGYVPGPSARNIKLSAGTHSIRCESGSRTYSGDVVIVANREIEISCTQLK